MPSRAAAILVENGRVALIDRHRAGLHYFTFPGGHVDGGETPEHAVVREVKEELGLDVAIHKKVAEIWWEGKPQCYYLVEIVSGTFGTGVGEEIITPIPERGTYQPVWMPIGEILDQPVLPRPMAELVVEAQTNGWLKQPVIIHE